MAIVCFFASLDSSLEPAKRQPPNSGKPPAKALQMLRKRLILSRAAIRCDADSSLVLDFSFCLFCRLTRICGQHAPVAGGPHPNHPPLNLPN